MLRKITKNNNKKKTVKKKKTNVVESSKFLGHGKCDDFSNSSSFNTRTCDPKQLATAVIKMWKQKPCHMNPTLLRGK